MSEKRLNNVHITSRASQCQGTLSLPRDCFGVCTLKYKFHKHYWDGGFSLNDVCVSFPFSSRLLLTFSKRKSTTAFSPNAAAHMRGVKPRSSCLLSSELSVKWNKSQLSRRKLIQFSSSKICYQTPHLYSGGQPLVKPRLELPAGVWTELREIHILTWLRQWKSIQHTIFLALCYYSVFVSTYSLMLLGVL